MSRLDPQVHEENRKANQKREIYNAHHQAVTKWLRENPRVGWLNGGKYYIIENGKSVPVDEFQNISA